MFRKIRVTPKIGNIFILIYINIKIIFDLYINISRYINLWS